MFLVIVLFCLSTCLLQGNIRTKFTASLVSRVMMVLTKKSILVLSTTAMVPGGAMGGALGGIVRQNCTFHFSWAAWSGNCRSQNNEMVMRITRYAQRRVHSDSHTEIHTNCLTSSSFIIRTQSLRMLVGAPSSFVKA